MCRWNGSCGLWSDVVALEWRCVNEWRSDESDGIGCDAASEL